MACQSNPNIKCSCSSNSCGRHGKCCECVAYHNSQGNLPVCMRK